MIDELPYLAVRNGYGLKRKPDGVEMAQTPWEFGTLLDIVKGIGPNRLLEVGAWHGGTLWYWLQLADLVVVVDDEMRDAGEWRKWARRAGRGRLELIQGDSADPTVIQQVAWHGPHDRGSYDVVFIDADHTYRSVKTDWENYAPMVNPGGIVAFHDITPRPDYGVNRLWRELKDAKGARTVEIVETWNQDEPGYGGVGVIYL